jgi:hypothetical protein
MEKEFVTIGKLDQIDREVISRLIKFAEYHKKKGEEAIDQVRGAGFEIVHELAWDARTQTHYAKYTMTLSPHLLHQLESLDAYKNAIETIRKEVYG